MNKGENKTPATKKRRKLDVWNKLAIGVLSIFLVGCISVFFILVNIINDPEGMQFVEGDLTTISNSRIYDRDGNLVTELGAEIREDITYEQIPQNVIDAFLSIEDSRYFDHSGFDLPRFLASALTNLRSGSLAQGGSTLTMQLIDNTFTTKQKEKLQSEQGGISTLDNIKLKVQEIYLSLIAEQTLDKEEIFEYYVNHIWFGSGYNTRGIQKAAKYFFNKDVSQLNLGEAAFLAGAINAPDTYNPLNNLIKTDQDYLANATERRNTTLALMLQHGYITETEYQLAVNTRLEFALDYQEMTNSDPNSPFISQVITEVTELTGQDPTVVPMDIYTTLNQDVQQVAYDICAGNIISFPNDVINTGFAVVENHTGEVIAVGAGRTYYSTGGKDDLSITERQPGSSMKPLLAYSSTFDLLGWSTEHRINDHGEDYFHSGNNLQNSDRTYHGVVNLKTALGLSLNTPAAQAMIELVNQTGYDYWVEFCKKLGYSEERCESFVEQYSIGGSNMYASPRQQASAYTMLANGGTRVNDHTVRNVIRRSDNKETAGDTTEYDLISEEAAFMTSYLLENVVSGNYGMFNEILYNPNYAVYGKSGTSDWGIEGAQYGIPNGNYRDEWSVGYTSDISVATWLGYTFEMEKQGYYFTSSVLYQATGFYITDYLIDYCAQFYNYKDIEKPGGVSSYNGGYIKTEFLSQGDSKVTGGNAKDESEDEEDEEKEEEEETKEEEKPEETEPEVDQAQQDCINQGGTWSNGVCTWPTDPGTGGETTDPGTGGETTDPGTGGGTVDPGTGGETTDPNAGATTQSLQTTGLLGLPRRFLFNIFSWL